MIHLWMPLALVGTLFGIGLYGILARRNAVLVLIGVELMLAAAGLLFVTVSTALNTTLTGPVLTIFIITIAAAEIAVALAVILMVYRLRGNIDVAAAGVDD